jgi:hypothetical protein
MNLTSSNLRKTGIIFFRQLRRQTLRGIFAAFTTGAYGTTIASPG